MPKSIVIVDENDFAKKSKEVFQKMMKDYPSLNMGDIQSISMFIKMFKETYF